MRKIILLLLASLCCLFAMAQPAPDSVTCIPNSQLRKAIRASETLRIMRLEMSVLKMNYDTMAARLIVKDSIIRVQERQVELGKDKVENLEGQKVQLQKKVALSAERAFHYQLKFQKQRGLTWTIGGVSVGLVIVALLVK